VENVVESISELDLDVDADVEVVVENEVASAENVDAALGSDVEVYPVQTAPGAPASASAAVHTLSAAPGIVSAVSVLDQDDVVFSAVHLTVVVV
jgi:hypothetical protein